MPLPLGFVQPERFALWELLPIVPPLWDEVSAAAGAGPKWGIDSYPAGGFPWFGSEPKAAVLAEDNG